MIAHQGLAAATAIALTFMLAGFVKGIVGMGLPTVAMSLLAVFFPPAQAAAILVIPSLVTNVWQLLAGPQFITVAKRFGTMKGGPVRAQQTEMTAEQKQQMKADLEATGLVAKAQAGFAQMQRRAA